MKKTFLAIVLLSGVLFWGVLAAEAQYGLDKTAAGAGYKVGQETIEGKASTYLNAALSLVAMVFFGFTLYSGIRWLTARGNEELVTKAKNALEAAIIGLVIVSLSWALTNFVFGRLTATPSQTQPLEEGTPLEGEGACYCEEPESFEFSCYNIIGDADLCQQNCESAGKVYKSFGSGLRCGGGS